MPSVRFGSKAECAAHKLMSVMGQKRTHTVQQAMSAKEPKADIRRGRDKHLLFW